MKNFLKKNYLLFLIFLLGLIIRFLYYPDNTYFGYDSARDSFTALEILKGDLKIVGPPTSLTGGLFHGALYYYLIAPVYLLFNHSPEAVSAFLRIVNSLGVFLVFGLGSIIFSRSIGLLAAFIYAISYEQSQYSLMFGHPSLTVIPVLIFYLGLSLLFFKNKSYGFIITLFALGLSIQLEAVYGLLFLNLFLFGIIFRDKLKNLSAKTWFLSVMAFCLSMSTYILAEIKFNFRSSLAIFSILESTFSLNHKSGENLKNYLTVAQRLIHDNLISENVIAALFLTGILIVAVFLMKDKLIRAKIAFLLVWFLAGLLPNILSDRFSYYYSAGASVGIIILALYFILRFKLSKILITLFLIIVTASNLILIQKQNPKGPNSDIIIQPGMLIKDQKKALDYIYLNSNKEPFAVNAITVPFNVNTTWSYLFQWYGQQKYGYLPVWGGEAASGFLGNLNVVTKRSDLPKKKFLIIEPPVGIPDYLITDFIKEENYFSKVLEEKSFGTIKVQFRERI